MSCKYISIRSILKSLLYRLRQVITRKRPIWVLQMILFRGPAFSWYTRWQHHVMRICSSPVFSVANIGSKMNPFEQMWLSHQAIRANEGQTLHLNWRYSNICSNGGVSKSDIISSVSLVNLQTLDLF